MENLVFGFCFGVLVTAVQEITFGLILTTFRLAMIVAKFEGEAFTTAMHVSALPCIGHSRGRLSPLEGTKAAELQACSCHDKDLLEPNAF